MYGDPRWDADELWTTMDHLYKGGIWLKKKSVLQADHHYDTEKSADGSTDLRTTGKDYYNRSSSILPSVAAAGNYFYLPALGYYGPNVMQDLGSTGAYWSSSATPWTSYTAAYSLGFGYGSDYVGVNTGFRDAGYRVEPTFK